MGIFHHIFSWVLFWQLSSSEASRSQPPPTDPLVIANLEPQHCPHPLQAVREQVPGGDHPLTEGMPPDIQLRLDCLGSDGVHSCSMPRPWPISLIETINYPHDIPLTPGLGWEFDKSAICPCVCVCPVYMSCLFLINGVFLEGCHYENEK